MRHICTACGHTDNVVEPFTRGEYTIDKRFGVIWRGRHLNSTGKRLQMFYWIAHSSHPVSAETLAIKVGSEMMALGIQREVAKLKMMLKRQFIEWPIVHIADEGYKWVS